MNDDVSSLERQRAAYRPQLPGILRNGVCGVAVIEGRPTGSLADEAAIRGRFPRTFGRPDLRLQAGSGPEKRRRLTVGVVLSGGQAPGGHNVIAGLYDALQGIDARSALHGFLDGPKGIFTGRQRRLDAAEIDRFRNSGGFDMIGSGRDKIESTEQLQGCLEVARRLGLDGLVIVGGDDSNTNAAVLAEYFAEQGCATVVAGVPKTIDGDLKGDAVEASFGFDTATRVYSELIGNIARDARSAGKYWHFIKLMGRSASHVTLECMLQTRVNSALIAEEVESRGSTLHEIVERLAGLVRRRAAVGRSYGVCLIPEGLIEFIPEMRALISELNRTLSETGPATDVESAALGGGLSDASRALFESLPPGIRRQLLLDRDAHGNVQVSKIDTEALLTQQVAERLDRWAASGEFHGKFQAQHHFFGYEGRCAAPSNFDADYTYALGYVATALIAFGKTGYLCGVQNLLAPAEQRTACGTPLTSMMRLETRKGRPTPVIAKALVRLDGAPFREFAARREEWAVEDAYLYPGAIQYFGPDEVSRPATRTLELEQRQGGA